MDILVLCVDSAFAFYRPQFPFAPLWLLGLVIARRYRRRHPALARTLTRGLSLCLLNSILIDAAWIYFKAQSGQEETAALADIVIHVLAPIVSLGGWLLLLAAIFAWRTDPTSAESVPPEKLPAIRTIVAGVLLGAVAGGGLFLGVSFYTPYYLPLFDAPRALYQARGEVVVIHSSTGDILGAMVQFGLGWGAFLGGTVAATTGLIRGAVLGAATALVALLIGSTSAPDIQSFARTLLSCPVAVLVGGLLGAGLQWVRQQRERK